MDGLPVQPDLDAVHPAVRSAEASSHEAALRRAAEPALEFRRSLGSRRHRPEMTFADMRRTLAAPLPELGCDAVSAIDELAALAEAGLGAMAGPRFFGWVVGGSHPVGVAADWLTSAWGQNCGGHTIAPAVAACEELADPGCWNCSICQGNALWALPLERR